MTTPPEKNPEVEETIVCDVCNDKSTKGDESECFKCQGNYYVSIPPAELHANGIRNRFLTDLAYIFTDQNEEASLPNHRAWTKLMAFERQLLQQNATTLDLHKELAYFDFLKDTPMSNHPDCETSVYGYLLEVVERMIARLKEDRDARVREVVQKILSCYSPDDTVNDYQDKIREFLTPPLSDKESV